MLRAFSEACREDLHVLIVGRLGKFRCEITEVL